MRLLKGFHAEVGKPLLLMFENLAQCIVFPNRWKKLNIAPALKKWDKQCIVNSCPVSLLPIYNKNFQRLILNPVFWVSWKKRNNYFLLLNLVFGQTTLFENLLPSTAHRIYTNISLQRFWIRIWSKSLEDFL